MARNRVQYNLYQIYNRVQDFHYQHQRLKYDTLEDKQERKVYAYVIIWYWVVTTIHIHSFNTAKVLVPIYVSTFKNNILYTRNVLLYSIYVVPE